MTHLEMLERINKVLDLQAISIQDLPEIMVEERKELFELAITISQAITLEKHTMKVTGEPSIVYEKPIYIGIDEDF